GLITGISSAGGASAVSNPANSPVPNSANMVPMTAAMNGTQSTTIHSSPQAMSRPIRARSKPIIARSVDPSRCTSRRTHSSETTLTGSSASAEKRDAAPRVAGSPSAARTPTVASVARPTIPTRAKISASGRPVPEVRPAARAWMSAIAMPLVAAEQHQCQHEEGGRPQEDADPHPPGQLAALDGPDHEFARLARREELRHGVQPVGEQDRGQEESAAEC